MSTPVYNVYFVAGNVDPTPPRPPKAPAKPAVRLALTPHAPPATPVAAPAAIPGTISVPRRPSAVQPAVPVGTDDDKQERRTTSSCSRSRTRRRHRASHHRHHHRDHHSPRSTSRSERGRSVRTARSSFSQALRPPPGQWDIHTGLWDPYVGNIPPRAHVPPPRVPAPPPLRPFSAFPLLDRSGRHEMTPTSQPVTPNQANIRSWLKNHQDDDYPMMDSMVKFVAQILDSTRYTPDHLSTMKLLVYDPQDHEHHPTDLGKSHYYLIKGHFSQREIPDPVRAAPAMNLQEVQHVNLVHASSIGGIKGIFSDQKIGPSRLHNNQSCSFFSLGSKRTNDRAWDDKEMARITHAAWYAAKNTSNILAVAVGWGTAEAVKQGGEWECVQKTMNGGCVHHQRGRMWVTNENSHKLLGFAFRVAAESPLD